MNRRTLLIIIGLLSAGILGIGGYLVFFGRTQEAAAPQRPGVLERFERRLTPQPGLEPRLQRLSQTPVFAPTMVGEKIRFFGDDDRIYEMNLDGTGQERLLANALPNVLKAVWSPDGMIGLFLLADPETIPRWHRYERPDGRVTPLDFAIREMAFASEGALGWVEENRSTGESTVKVTASSTAEAKTLFSLRSTRLRLLWGNTSTLYLEEPPSGFTPSTLHRLGTDGTVARPLRNIFGLFASPASDGTIAYSSTNPSGKELRLNILTNGNTTPQATNFETIAEKCVWAKSGKTLYCAVPISLPGERTYPDDLLKGVVATQDRFFAYDREAGGETFLYEPPESVDATQLFLDPEEQYLYFINKNGGQLWGLRLQ